MLGRSESTISREIARNAGSAADYASHTAQAFCAARRRAARPMAKLDPRGLRWDVVRTLLGWRCSPQQIAATLARVFPDEPDRHVSHETIYTTIYAQPRGELRRQLRRSLTYDQGKELARHKELTRRIGVAVYFCDPHSPWQRGTCENTNGLLRQYLPKGTDLGGFSQDDLEAVADSLNTRPRATHAFNTPLAVFRQMLALTHEPSPSAH